MGTEPLESVVDPAYHRVEREQAETEFIAAAPRRKRIEPPCLGTGDETPQPGCRSGAERAHGEEEQFHRHDRYDHACDRENPQIFEEAVDFLAALTAAQAEAGYLADARHRHDRYGEVCTQT